MKQQLQTWLQSLSLEAEPTMDDAIEHLGELFPLLKEYKNTKQDPIWHAEGDVHIHTDMVLQELYKIFNNNEMDPPPSPEERLILILGAILHDIGKPLVTKESEGRVRAPRHETVGRDYAALRLSSLNLPTMAQCHILGLIGYHQSPKLLIIREEPDNEFIKLDQIVPSHLIYWLEVADLRGRTCEDREESLMYLDEYLKKNDEIHLRLLEEKEQVRYFKHFQVKDANYLLANGLVNSHHEVAGYRYRAYGEADPFYFTMLCGIPGSGKTHLRVNFLQKSKNVISLDNIRAELGKGPQDFSNEPLVLSTALERVKECLRNRTSVLYDATNLRADQREAFLTLAHNYQAITRLYVLIPSIDFCIRNDKNREFSVGEKVIWDKVARFQMPTPYEASMVYYINPRTLVL